MKQTKNWHSDAASFINSDNPFFSRGGSGYLDSDSAGVFYFYNGNGISNQGDSFRICLTVN